MTEVEKSRRKRRILLADNNESVQRVVREVAEKRGHQLMQATTGASTLLLAIETQPDLIVLDLAFPDADGRDVLRQLKTNPETLQIPVVVWSGRTGHDSDSRISLDLGAEDYVEKDDAHLLMLKLERVLLRLNG
jgi:CheY-like chemotaxis protein